MVGKLLYNNRSNQIRGVHIPAGKLAAQQWYESDPSLLAAEKAAMQHVFPNFKLDKLDDGSLCWIGDVKIGISCDEWTVMALYNYNHPQQVLGGSVRVYLVKPNIDELIEGIGNIPFPILPDENNLYYLCLFESEVTSAASHIVKVVYLLTAFELTQTGELSWDDYVNNDFFNSLKIKYRNRKLLLPSDDSQKKIGLGHIDVEDIVIPLGRLASSEEDEITRKREELKRKLIEGRKGLFVPVDWAQILDEVLLKGVTEYNMPSEISPEEIKRKLCLVLFDPWSARYFICHDLLIPKSGWNDERIYEKKWKLLDSYIKSLLYINKTYKYLLSILDNEDRKKTLNDSAKKFQWNLIRFFYDSIPVDYADSHADYYNQDWMRHVDFELNVSIIKYKEYEYDIFEKFIKRIDECVFLGPRTLLGKLIFCRKVDSLEKIYMAWKDENRKIIEDCIEKYLINDK